MGIILHVATVFRTHEHDQVQKPLNGNEERREEKEGKVNISAGNEHEMEGDGEEPRHVERSDEVRRLNGRLFR